ncbi:ABC transporter [Paenibacillus sp. CF384]|nr:ABC transporter [Paenibacillus sp. CF384]
MLLYGEKIMLLGPNGTGKTTLFKLILGTEAPDSGTIDIGARVDIGYLAQQQYPADDKKNVLAYFREAAGMEEGEARSHLARYLFTQGDVFKSVSQLSGGEWTRLRLALLILKKPNLLLLDEPTNHMDIASREALEDALEDFPGTILAISHDRYFINRLANKVWELDRAALTVYLGAYDDYAEKRKQLRTEESQPLAVKKEAYPVKRNQAADHYAHSPSKQPKPNTEKLEQQISQLEARLAEMDMELNEKSEQIGVDELAQRWREREQVQEQLNDIYTKWMEP